MLPPEPRCPVTAGILICVKDPGHDPVTDPHYDAELGLGWQTRAERAQAGQLVKGTPK